MQHWLVDRTDRDGGGDWQNVIGELIALIVTEGETDRMWSVSWSHWSWRRGRLRECDWLVDRTDRDGGGDRETVIGELIALTVTEGETERMWLVSWSHWSWRRGRLTECDRWVDCIDRNGGGDWQNVIGELIALTVTEGETDRMWLVSWSHWSWRRGRLRECDWLVDRTDHDGGGDWETVIGELIALTVTEGETERMWLVSWSHWSWRRGRLTECDRWVDRIDRNGGGDWQNVIDELIALTVTEGETDRMWLVSWSHWP